MDCIFCKIADGRIKSDIVYQDDNVVAFNDIKPQAPVHVLIIPRQHVETTNEIGSLKIDALDAIFKAVVKIAKMKQIDQTGYRTVLNCKKDAGQEVYHLHVHLLGGRKFNWPPG